MLTIDDILDSLCNMDNDKRNKLSPREIWDLIANKASLEDMGFDTESEKKEFIEENPYNSL